MAIAWGTDSNLDDELFYNRKEDLEFLTNILDSSQYGSTPTILLTGIRGVGKTALMNKLKRDFKGEYLVIYADLSSSDKYQEGKFTGVAFMELLYREIMGTCEDFGLKTAKKRIEKYVKTHDINPIKQLVAYGNVPVPIPGFEENYPKLANFVMELPQKIYEEYEDRIKGVFIFIDEFQIIKELDNYDKFLWFLRSIVQSQSNVAYMFTGSMSINDSLIEDIAGKNGAFGGRMLSVDIAPFSYETTKNYLKERADFLKFSEDGYERFFKCTKGVPFYINIFARLISPDKLLTGEIVKKEFYEAISFLSAHLKNLWFKLSYSEQKIIIQLLDEPLKRIEIANNLGITSGALSQPLVKLQDMRLIEINDERKYQIVDSILGLWLKKEYDVKGVYPFRIS